MSRIKKTVKAIIGNSNAKKLNEYLKGAKPKMKTEKPIAFLVGFSKWKYDHMRTYLFEYEVRFVLDNELSKDIIEEMNNYQDKVIMVWGYKDRGRLREYASDKKIPYYRIEDGFIRSVQLGASKSVPLSMCFDSQVLYYDSSKPSRSVEYL